MQVEFHDMSDPATREQFADVAEAVRKHSLNYPLTAINGVFRYAGAVSYYACLRAVQETIGAPAQNPAEV